MADPEMMSDAELRKKLGDFGFPVGPVTDSTRNIMRKKLKNLLDGKGSTKPKKSLAAFSSGEDEDEPREAKKGRGGPMPTATARLNRRKTSTPVVQDEDEDSSPTRRRTSRQTIVPVTKKTTPARTGRGYKMVSEVLDYETGSDDDRVIEPKKPETPPKSASKSYKPFDLLGLKPPTSYAASTSYDEQQARSSTPFYSEFGRRLGENGSASPSALNSNNGHFSSTRMSRYPAVRSDMARSDLGPPLRAQPPTSQSDEHSMWNGAFISKALIAILVVFFAYLAYCYVGMRSAPDSTPQLSSFESNPDNKFPLCKDGQMPGVNCVVSSEARAAMLALKTIVPRLTEEAVKARCGSDYGSTKAGQDMLSFKMLQDLLELDGDPDAENTVANMRILTRHNPHWGVAVLEMGMAVSDPPLPLLCYMQRKLVSFFQYAVIAILVGGALGMVFWALYMQRRSRALKLRQIDALVKRAKDCVLAQAQLKRDEDSQELACMPLVALRDELIPSQEFPGLENEWNKAVERLTSEEHGIRLEVRRLAGEEVPCLVWTGFLGTPTRVPGKGGKPVSPGGYPKPQFSNYNALLPYEFMHASESSDRNDMSDFHDMGGGKYASPTRMPSKPHPYSESAQANTNNSNDSPIRRQRVWQGQAFETQEGSVNSLAFSPTPCLKIRKMFDPETWTRGGEDKCAWLERIRNAIMEKCGPLVNILHVSVDEISSEGCVYVKCASPADAGRAYRALHGSWYDGNLVTVKYLHLKRYHERFPDAIDSCIPLRPSNNKQLSLQAHWLQSNLERS